MKKSWRCEKNDGGARGVGSCDWSLGQVEVNVVRQAREMEPGCERCQAEALLLDPAGRRPVSGFAAGEKVDQTWVLE